MCDCDTAVPSLAFPSLDSAPIAAALRPFEAMAVIGNSISPRLTSTSDTPHKSCWNEGHGPGKQKSDLEIENDEKQRHQIVGKYAGRTAGVMFAIALIDASIIGASAVSLSTAYAIGDVLSLRHSLRPCS